MKKSELKTIIKEILNEAIRVDTTPFTISHAKDPKGSGWWAFVFDKKDVNTMNDMFSFSGSYGEAIKQAKKVAKEKGANIIYVLP